MLIVAVSFSLNNKRGNEVKICAQYFNKGNPLKSQFKYWSYKLAMVFISFFSSLCAPATECECDSTGISYPVVLTFLSHLHIFPAGNILAPGTLDSPGIAIKLALPRLLQEEELWRNSNTISLAICAYLQLMPDLETTASGITAMPNPMPAWPSLSHLIRAKTMSRKQQT